MPRKSRAKQPESSEPVAIADTLEALKANPAIKLASELQPPAADLPIRVSGQEYPTFEAKVAAKRVKPNAPRRKDPNAPFNLLASPSVRIDKDGQVFELTFSRELKPGEYAQLQKWGFDDVTEHDTGKQWVGYRRELLRAGTDLNYVAMVLSGKQERER